MLNFTLPSDPAVRLELVAGGFQIIDMLREVEEELPPFRAVFSPHGNPNLVPDHELRDMAQEAANKGTCAFQFHSTTPSLPASSLQHPWLFQPFTSSLSLTTTLSHSANQANNGGTAMSATQRSFPFPTCSPATLAPRPLD
ncbi:hypothetical protein B0H14DRAFT_3554427 [Mycena olivaceomarginata]|nr:hypothetical protein B0H14DRAFT_3554427 [Mycena olivaceomarginata]